MTHNMKKKFSKYFSDPVLHLLLRLPTAKNQVKVLKTAKYSQKVAFPSLSSLTLLRLGFFDFLRTGGGQNDPRAKNHV